MKNRVRKLKREIGKNELGELIIDQSKNNDEVGNRIDILAKEFQKLEENEGIELANEREEEEIMPTVQDYGNPFREREMGIPRIEERPKSKRREREKALAREVEMDLSGESARRNMPKSSLGNTKEAHLVVLGDFEKQEDVKLYGRLPDYDDLQCYDLGAWAFYVRLI